MATVFFTVDNIRREIQDGEKLLDFCEPLPEISLPFGCTEGTCGICELTVLEGSENCSALTDSEKEYLYPEEIANGMRLGCQMRIQGGEVALTWKTPRAKEKT